MNTPTKKPSSETIILSIAMIILVGGSAGFTEYRFRQLKAENNFILGQAKERESSLSATIASLQNQSADISSSFQSEAQKSRQLVDKIDNISNTVGALDKLSKVDSLLLQKYSKVYFLNENYTPANLTNIDTGYALEDGRTYQFLSAAYPYLNDLFKDAHNAGIDLRVASAYRSFNTQGDLKTSYKVTYGSGANTFSAEQGYSEHQLGTTIDFSTQAVGGAFSSFEKDPAYDWLNQNAYKYGFVISYPKGNKSYVFEPWHWRFVGIDLAEKLHDDNKYFYDLDQREIDKYLVKLFD